MKTLLILVLILLLGGSGIRAESIYSLITKGNLQQALDSLSQVSTASTRDGNLLFYASLLETDAEKSVQMMQAALGASVSAMHREQIYYRPAHFWFIKGDIAQLKNIVAEYLATWEVGHYRSDMLRFALLVDEQDQQYEAATRQVDRFLLAFPKGENGQLGKIDKARVMKQHGKNIASRKLFRELSRGRDGPGVPLALYALTQDAVSHKKTDDAVYFYNLLKDSYPSAVGLDALIEQMTDLSNSSSTDTEAEKITGTFYSVRVGVFSVPDNADRQAKLFRKHGQPVEVVSRKISEADYKIVLVGRFSSYQAAANFKKQLEKEHREVFQVVAR